MKRATFSIIFFVKRERVNKNGTLPIYSRITINGERAQFVIQRTIEESLWDNGRGQAKGFSKEAREVNDYLDFIKSKLREHRIYMEERNEEITAFSLKEKYMGIDSKSKTILEIFKEHNEKCLGLMNKDFAPATVLRYETTYRHLENFIKTKYKRFDLSVNEITPMFVSDFEYYFKVNRKCNHNTTIKYIKNFKKIVLIAIANGWMKNNPFSNIKYHFDDVDMAYLTEEELRKVMEREFKIERLQQVRDVYLFCCFTGLAFVDVKNLSYKDIEEKDGQYWIRKKRQKTKNWCNIPLLEPAVNLMNKYRKHPFCIKNELVLPVSSCQKMNAYLGEIADICEINKHLSTHTARHTFATTVTLSNHISMEVVSKMLGHSSINMTKKYARVVDDLISKDMQKLSGKYN